jgi:hypothetical protein
VGFALPSLAVLGIEVSSQAYPSCRLRLLPLVCQQVVLISRVHADKNNYVPLEASIILHKLIKIRHEFIYYLPHVPVSGLNPDRISVRQVGNHVLTSAATRFELVSGRKLRKLAQWLCPALTYI